MGLSSEVRCMLANVLSMQSGRYNDELDTTLRPCECEHHYAYQRELVFACARPEGRLSAAIEKQPNLDLFLSRFTDSHGVPLNPATLMAKPDTPSDVLMSDAITAFRDIISVCVVPGERALAICFPHQARIYYADTFAIYPWMLDKVGKHLHAVTPALLASHNVEDFRGMSSPEISVRDLRSDQIDAPLFQALIERWDQRFTAQAPVRSDIALFRSLNVANHAMMVPAAKNATLHDYGRIISMWISAFEILFHPGGGKKAGLGVVYERLSAIKWRSESLFDESHPSYAGRSGRKNRSLACWIYGEMYQARNAFLHGEDVGNERLLFPAGRFMVEFAAPLYRMALAQHLGLFSDQQFAEGASLDEMFAEIDRHQRFERTQRQIEQALRVATDPPEEWPPKRKTKG